MNAMTELPNIGPVLAEELCKIGVETPEQLRAMGAKEVWQRIRIQLDPGACLHKLQALEGAVEGIPKRTLSAEKRAELNEFFKNRR